MALPTAEFKNATFGAETSIKMSNVTLEEFFRNRSINIFQVELNDNFATRSMLCFPYSKKYSQMRPNNVIHLLIALIRYFRKNFSFEEIAIYNADTHSNK